MKEFKQIVLISISLLFYYPDSHGSEKKISQKLKKQRDEFSLQSNTNKLLWEYARNGDSEKIKELFQLSKGKEKNKTPTISALDLALQVATFFNQQKLVSFLLTKNSLPLAPSQHGINRSFELATQKNNYPLIDIFLKNKSSSILLPTQNAVNHVLNLAPVANDAILFLNNLLCTEEKTIAPNEAGIQTFLGNLFHSFGQGNVEDLEFNKDIIKFMLNKHLPNYRVNQGILGTLFQKQAQNGNLGLLNFLMTLNPDIFLLPDQKTIDRTVIALTESNNLAAIEFLYAQIDTPLRPSEFITNIAHRDARAHRYTQLEEFLENQLDPEIRAQARQERLERLQANVNNQAVAFEIHDYAQASVLDKTCGNGGKNVKLIDYAFSYVQNALSKFREQREEYGNKKDLGDNEDESNIEFRYEVVSNKISELIKQIFPPNQRELALEASLFRLAGDENYEKNISLIFNYIHLIHPEKMEIWVKGFIGENILAYKNSKNSSSCTKGIRERLATGLRGIDPELDRIFGIVEGKTLIKFYIAQWNPSGNPNLTAKLLQEGGVKQDDSKKIFIEKFIKIFNQQIKANNLNEEDFSMEREIIADSIEENYHNIQGILKMSSQ